MLKYRLVAMKNLFVYKAFIIAMLLMFTINLGTSPLPPPYFTYKVSGTIFCDSLTNVENYTVFLYGKQAERNYLNILDSLYHPIEGMGNYNEHPIDNSDSDGKYYISVDSEIRFDSIKVMVIRPNQKILYSIPIYIAEEDLQAITEEYDASLYGAVGCSGCSTENIETRVVKYNYKLFDFNIMACFN